MRNWTRRIDRLALHESIQYVQVVNQQYDAIINNVSANELVELRLLRSLWAKQIARNLVIVIPTLALEEFIQVCTLLASLRTLLHQDAVQRLLLRQRQIGDATSNSAVASLLAEHALAEEARVGLRELGNPSELVRRLGPMRISKFRPSRKSSNFDPAHWLGESEMTQLDFVDGDPDRIRIRGIELHSGDIGIVELNHPGDGLLESFLEKPGVAPHAMLYVTRRCNDARSNRTLYQPSAMEIYEGGWRCVPITTALHPEFSWYSEWVRPKLDGQDLPDDLGRMLSTAIDEMEPFSFDFLARRIPAGGYFTEEFEPSCASCTNLVRVPFERAGIHGLPYPITRITPIAARNLGILGLPEMDGIYTPTNILKDSGFEKVGIVDNGEPEMGYAQALVIGRPELAETFGGWMSQKKLVLENLPHWKSVKNWKSAWEAFRVGVGQSDGIVSRTIRKVLNYSDCEVPRSVSDTTIAFYLRSDLEAAHIIKNIYPTVLEVLENSSDLLLLSHLRAMHRLVELIEDGLLASALKKENWYESV